MDWRSDVNEALQDKEGGVIAHLGTPLSTYTDIGVTQWRRNRNTVKGAGVRGWEGADYPHEASVCKGSATLGVTLPLLCIQFITVSYRNGRWVVRKQHTYWKSEVVCQASHEPPLSCTYTHTHTRRRPDHNTPATVVSWPERETTYRGHWEQSSLVSGLLECPAVEMVYSKSMLAARMSCSGDGIQ